jgi:DNA-directed RNA polymerase subunit RPC12/RpoP
MAQGDPFCEYCGKDCGNAGAKSNHEAACSENPANQEGGGQRAEIERAGRQEATPAAPAGPQGAGEAAGDILFTLANPDAAPPEARKQARSQGISILGSVLHRYNELRFRNEKMQEERAKNAELERADKYVECGECGYQFGPDAVGSNEQVRCPECNTLWVVKDVVGQPEADG